MFASKNNVRTNNFEKANWMVAAKINTEPHDRLTLGDGSIKRVTKFKYFGCWINSNNDSDMKARMTI